MWNLRGGLTAGTTVTAGTTPELSTAVGTVHCTSALSESASVTATRERGQMIIGGWTSETKMIKILWYRCTVGVTKLVRGHGCTRFLNPSPLGKAFEISKWPLMPNFDTVTRPFPIDVRHGDILGYPRGMGAFVTGDNAIS